MDIIEMVSKLAPVIMPVLMLIVGIVLINHNTTRQQTTIIKSQLYKDAFTILSDATVELALAQDKESRDQISNDTARKMWKIFDMLSFFGSKKLKSWIKEKRASSIANPPQPWLTPANIEGLKFLLSEDLKLLTIKDKIRAYINN